MPRDIAKEKEMQISVKLNKLGEPLGDTLFGKTVFIMGYGSIGIELAKLLRPFGVKILATKRNWTSYVPNRFSSTDAHQDAIDEKGCHEDICEFAKKSDIIVCCLRMSSETAGIDVAWTEPFDQNDPIINFPNVLLTPHVAGATKSAFRSMAKVVGDLALQLHSGKALTGIEYAN